MTIIAAIATGTHVVMGCDTATDYSGTAIYSAEGKIAVLNPGTDEPVLLAAAGNASIIPVVRRSVKFTNFPDPRDIDATDAWADTIADAITTALADANPSVISPNTDGSPTIDGSLLMAWRSHLWWIYTHAARRPHSPALAIGSGTDVALGSLHTSIALGNNATEAVDLAVRLACRHTYGCGIDDRGPILHTTKE